MHHPTGEFVEYTNYTSLRTYALANSIALDDCNLSLIAAQEELGLVKKNNLANCLQITALQEALLKAEALANCREWVPVSEKPKKAARYLVISHHHNGQRVVNSAYWTGGAWDRRTRVSFWSEMPPLPEPPKP